MDMMTILVAACVLNILGSVIQSVMLHLFLDQTETISDQADLDRFKGVARVGMYLTLGFLPVMLAMVVSSVIVAITWGVNGLITVLLLNGVVFVVSKFAQRLEEKARSLEAASEDLAAAHQRISEVWTKKAFPDF
jgi:ABC-type sugar transport system permease subunit